MAQYQTIARRYRPQNFSQVFGQETIVTILKNALRLNRVANAYLFSGSKGTGKTTLARIFAKALNCLNPSGQEPCNSCDSCKQIQNHSSLDVIEIDGASNRGIDDIRQINETCGYAPALGKFKIYIIDEVHMLTKEAFNALLKTLEEPPAHVKFFFATTEAHKVLPTILSRCQRFDLMRLSADLIIGKLTKIASDLNITIEEDALKLIAKISAGSLRDAESILDQMLCLNPDKITLNLIQTTLGIFHLDRFFGFDKAFEKQHYPFAFHFAQELFKEGIDITFFLETFLEHLRNIMAVLFDMPLDESFYTKEQIQHYQSLKSIYRRPYCFYAFQLIMKQLQQQNKWQSQVQLELFLLHLLEAKNRVTLDEVMQEVENLQKSGKDIPVQKEPVKPPSPVASVSNPAPTTPPLQSKTNFETLLQFAGVELHGVIKK